MNIKIQPKSSNEDCVFSSIEDICDIIGAKLNSPGWTDCFGTRLNSYLNQIGAKKIKTLSLFSGAGGLDIGFSDAGFEIVESVEIESQFCETLRHNSGKGHYFNGNVVNNIDIRRYTGEHLKDIEWIIGGPPCQTFSAAGRRVAGVLGTSDARGTLFKEYVRLLKTIKPRGFLFENVFGIIGAQKGEPWKEIQEAFIGAGYRIYYRILDAADYGTPQHRERLVIIGLQDGSFSFPRPTHGPDSRQNIPFYNAGIAIKDVKSTEDLSKCEIKGRFRSLIEGIPPGLNYSYYTEEMGHPNPVFAWRSKFSDFMYKADPEEPVRTITATGRQYTGPLHWDNRYFTCDEYKRLQTFPDNYSILGAKPVVLKQIGNSVPPQLARILALCIRGQVFGTKLPFVIETIDDSFEMTYKYRKRELSKKYREDAIRKLKSFVEENTIIEEKSSYYLSISDKFEFIMSKSHGKFLVESEWTRDSLKIIVDEHRDSFQKHTEIRITPKNNWTLPVKQVVLIANSRDWEGICTAWRVFDHELIAHNLKADIIQLNGYYLYESNLICILSSEISDNMHIMKSLMNGECTQKIVSTSYLANVWGINENDVFAKAQMIKELGFDIRNWRTNTQLQINEWIIPYKFPSLVPQSLQLYKEL